MIIIALTDIHGALSHLEQIERELRAADWVFLGGDITHFGGASAAADVINYIRKMNSAVFAVAGNCDEPEVDAYLGAENLGGHGRISQKRGLTVLGVGGSLPVPVFTPNTFSEDEYKVFFSRMEGAMDSPPDILVSHQPPWRTNLDKVWGMKHVGSRSLRNYIERAAPRLVFCGHIHESSGCDTIGDTRLVNPGPFRHGKYARICFDEDTLEIELF